MDYRINKVGDDWYFLPDKEKTEKSEYERLFHRIKRREKRIQRIEKEELPKLKKELREWKKDRTKQYNQLVKYHKEFIPKFSVSLSKNPKKKDVNNIHGSSVTKGNRSWTIYVSIQNERKSIYLGTMKDVNRKLDLIEGTSIYCDYFPDKSIPHRNKVTRKIEELIYPLIKEEMLEILVNEGNLDSFINQKIQGMKYLNKLYKNSENYEEPKPKEPKPKGKRMEVFRPPSSYWKKKDE